MQGKGRSGFVTQETEPQWCETIRYLQETPNTDLLELELYPEHYREPLKDFNKRTVRWTYL
jgi:hypothetical protein